MHPLDIDFFFSVNKTYVDVVSLAVQVWYTFLKDLLYGVFIFYLFILSTKDLLYVSLCLSRLLHNEVEQRRT